MRAVLRGLSVLGLTNKVGEVDGVDALKYLSIATAGHSLWHLFPSGRHLITMLGGVLAAVWFLYKNDGRTTSVSFEPCLERPMTVRSMAASSDERLADARAVRNRALLRRSWVEVFGPTKRFDCNSNKTLCKDHCGISLGVGVLARNWLRARSEETLSSVVMLNAYFSGKDMALR